MYYKVNEDYGILLDNSILLTLNKQRRNMVPYIALPNWPALSTFGTNRAKRLLMRDKVALNWVIGSKADLSRWTDARWKPTLGADPEFFLTEGAKLVPAFEVLSDKKTSPQLFWDGFQAEFTLSSWSCIQLVTENIQRGLWRLLSVVRAKNAKLSLLPQDSVRIEPKRYKPEFLQLGCDPSLNAYGVTGDIPMDPSLLPWRFAGGHIHFGAEWLKNHPDKVREAVKIVKALDKTLGIFSVSAGAAYERNKIRRRYYGLAGEFRLPPHGLEYRTLSNWWMCHPAITHMTLEFARAIFQIAPLGLLDFWYGDEDTVQGIINTYDVPEARKLLKKNEKLFLEIFQAANENFSIAGEEKELARKAFQVGIEGIEYAVRDVTDIETNWKLAVVTDDWDWQSNRTQHSAGWFATWQKHAATLR